MLAFGGRFIKMLWTIWQSMENIWETLASYKSVWITLGKKTVNETPGEIKCFGGSSRLEIGEIRIQIRVFSLLILYCLDYSYCEYE